VSEATKRFHHRFNFVPNRRMDVVHNFINCANYRTRHESCNLDVRRSFGFADSDVVVAQVGDVIPRKGLVHLVRALPEILQRCPAVKVLVVGRRDVDYARTVRTEIDRLGVGPAVVWAGYRADIGNILPSVDIFALATLEDSLPLAILEAMACGLPVVASRVGGIPECVVDGETGFLVRPKRPREFVTAVIRLAEDHSLRLRMGRAGRRRVETNFSHESQVERLERTFQRVLARSTTNTLQRGGSGVSMGLPNVRIVIPDRFAARQVADMDLPIIENR
jgi:glycosyltransferase involved in cell wall biosynthesis